MQSLNSSPHHPKFLKKTHEVSIPSENKLIEQIKLNSHALTTFSIGPFPVPFVVWRPFGGENQGNKEKMKRLKKITSMLQQEKLISHLTYTIDTENASEMTFAISKLKRLQNITSLDLSSPCFNDPYFLKSLFINLRNLKKLTSLTINFPLRVGMNPKLLASLLALKRLNSLKSLSLIATSTRGFDGPSWDALSSSLSKLTQLKSLTLTLTNCLMVSDSVLSSFAPIFRKLNSLENFSIGLFGCGTVQNQSIINFFNSIKGLKFLKSLLLNLGRCRIKMAPFDLISKGLSVLNPSQLESLDLNYYSEPNDQCLEDLGTALQRFSSLRNLSLDFSESLKISDQGLSQLASGIQTLRSLSSLHLELSSLYDTTATVQIIATALKPLVNLTTLNLNFLEQNSISNHQFGSFSDALQGLTALRNLTLKFNNLYDVIEESFLALSKAIQGLSELSVLNLELLYNVNLTNKAFIHLSSSIGGLNKLNDLSINCLGSRNLNKESTDSLGQALKSLSSLEAISLNFNYCQSLQDEEDIFLEIFKALSQMKFLRKIQMSLPSRKFNGKSCELYTRHVPNQKISWT